jgi:hypothetical protein|tara:strand:- start:5332 stop:7974 length:2643 start_codon:yes stop_codon:yes gene_type:complete
MGQPSNCNCNCDDSGGGGGGGGGGGPLPCPPNCGDPPAPVEGDGVPAYSVYQLCGNNEALEVDDGTRGFWLKRVISTADIPVVTVGFNGDCIIRTSGDGTYFYKGTDLGHHPMLVDLAKSPDVSTQVFSSGGLHKICDGPVWDARVGTDCGFVMSGGSILGIGNPLLLGDEEYYENGCIGSPIHPASSIVMDDFMKQGLESDALQSGVVLWSRFVVADGACYQPYQKPGLLSWGLSLYGQLGANQSSYTYGAKISNDTNNIPELPGDYICSAYWDNMRVGKNNVVISCYHQSHPDTSPIGSLPHNQIIGIGDVSSHACDFHQNRNDEEQSNINREARLFKWASSVDAPSVVFEDPLFYGGNMQYRHSMTSVGIFVTANTASITYLPDESLPDPYLVQRNIVDFNTGKAEGYFGKNIFEDTMHSAGDRDYSPKKSGPEPDYMFSHLGDDNWKSMVRPYLSSVQTWATQFKIGGSTAAYGGGSVAGPDGYMTKHLNRFLHVENCKDKNGSLPHGHFTTWDETTVTKCIPHWDTINQTTGGYQSEVPMLFTWRNPKNYENGYGYDEYNRDGQLLGEIADIHAGFSPYGAITFGGVSSNLATACFGPSSIVYDNGVTPTAHIENTFVQMSTKRELCQGFLHTRASKYGSSAPEFTHDDYERNRQEAEVPDSQRFPTYADMFPGVVRHRQGRYHMFESDQWCKYPFGLYNLDATPANGRPPNLIYKRLDNKQTHTFHNLKSGDNAGYETLEYPIAPNQWCVSGDPNGNGYNQYYFVNFFRPEVPAGEGDSSDVGCWRAPAISRRLAELAMSNGSGVEAIYLPEDAGIGYNSPSNAPASVPIDLYFIQYSHEFLPDTPLPSNSARTAWTSPRLRGAIHSWMQIPTY